MSDVAIKIENLTKKYKIFDKPADRMKEALNPFGKRYSKDFYALNDVSLTINKGETVGIVGKNGAGKSTILKIITGVLTPTSGSVQVNGKIASLLELGAGFNPEMTGRENIYLNGILMGYSREEMEQRVQEIVEFADIGEFIDQPVKMYSSGMFARLAFSVNIAVEPDILIVDEALSVGDFMFQFKCMQKFKELQEKGTTILFVTHSSQQIINVCNRAIFLSNGSVAKESYDVKDVVYTYEENIRNVESTLKKEKDIAKKGKKEELADDGRINTEPNKELNEYRYGNHEAVVDHVYINYDDSDEDVNLLESGKRVFIKLYIKSSRKIEAIVGGISIQSKEGLPIWGNNTLNASNEMKLKKGWNILVYETFINIVPGEYILNVGLAEATNDGRIELDQRRPAKIVKIISKQISHYDGPVFSNDLKVYMLK